MYINGTYSTNGLMKSLLTQRDDPQWLGLWSEPLPCLCAGYQTAGRGQQGNSWESDAEKNILMSVYIDQPAISVERQFALSQAVSLAVVEGVERVIGSVGLTIKWPNDIYYGDKKLAGILIETELSSGRIRHAIAGIGLNVLQTRWYQAPNPTSVRLITGRKYKPDKLIEAIIARLRERLSAIDEQELSLSYEQRLYRREGYHLYEDALGLFSARIQAIDEFGRLVLETEQGEQRVYMLKQVHYIIPTKHKKPLRI